jgi:pyruvate kinase
MSDAATVNAAMRSLHTLPLALMRKTKILVTLGPATESVAMIETLIRTGANIFRLNMSHASHEWTRNVYNHVRQAAIALKTDVAVLMDLTGPSIRTGDVPAPWQLKAGDVVELRTDEAATPTTAYSTTVNYPGLTKDLRVGDPISIDGGMVMMRTTMVNGQRILAEVVTGGEMKSRRHINLPGVDVNLPPLTKKDYVDLDLGVELGVDYFALSFAREPAHIQHLELILEQKNCSARVIAKIENQQALNNLDAIVLASKGVMVARGDLGSECPVEDLPIIQRDIIERCSYHGRKVIVATQMLESMIENPVPTRAEVTDIFNAVTEQVDCVMLSGETSVGKYPERCVDILHRVISRTEQRYAAGRFASDAPLKTNKHKAVKAAVVLANSIAGSKLLVFTKGGVTAHLLAHQRPEYAPVFAFTEALNVSRALMTARGVFPFVLEFGKTPAKTIDTALQLLKDRGLVVSGDPVVILSDVLHDDMTLDSILLKEA